MFSGDWIEHQELNLTDSPARVIQIWFAADIKHRGLPPHYQQLSRGERPSRRVGEAEVFSLIGSGSPMEQHMNGRVTAAAVPAGGSTALEPPRSGENLFLYFTGGAGRLNEGGGSFAVGQYDVILARPDAPAATLAAPPNSALYFLSYYLPAFLGN